MTDMPMQLNAEQMAYLQQLGSAPVPNGPPPGPPHTHEGLEGGNEALMAFAQALAAVQPIAKTQTADTGRYTYRYADLGDVLEECKRAAGMFGLALTQNPSMSDSGMLSVGTTLIHTLSGQWLTFPPIMMKMPSDAQAVGSALTYMRRYALLTIFGIAPEDDDGATATRAARQAAAQTESGFRSEAERLFHEEMQSMPVEDSRAMRAEFKTLFGMGLSDLPVSKHGDALTWLRQWSPPPAETAAATVSAAAAVSEAAEPEAVGPPPAPPASDISGSEIPLDVTPADEVGNDGKYT